MLPVDVDYYQRQQIEQYVNNQHQIVLGSYVILFGIVHLSCVIRPLKDDLLDVFCHVDKLHNKDADAEIARPDNEILLSCELLLSQQLLLGTVVQAQKINVVNHHEQRK